jgi:hypothetical protein
MKKIISTLLVALIGFGVAAPTMAVESSQNCAFRDSSLCSSQESIYGDNND